MTFLSGPAMTILFTFLVPLAVAYLAYEAAVLWESREW